ncbi:MAG: TlpA disulfide reductase family protein [Bacteroidota bacterium]
MGKHIITIALLLVSLASIAQQRRSPHLDSLRNEKDSTALQTRIQKLAIGNESEMNVLVQYYSANRTKADSLYQKILLRFPKGNTAALAAQTKIFNEPAEKQEVMFSQFKKDFPEADDDQIIYSIAYAYASVKNMPKAAFWTQQIKRPEFKYSVIETIITKDLNTAELMVKKDLEKYGKGEKNANYFMVISTYSNILTKLGKNDTALLYAKEAFKNDGRKSDLLTRNYAYLSSLNGDNNIALPLMAKLTVDGKADKQLKDQLLVAYLKLNPKKNAVLYLDSLQHDLRSKMQEQVAKLMVSEQSPAFVLKDADGKTVSLSDFKGKTIVLDFWATWCGPCKRSFPAMQMAVNKYKNDPSVKFLFIHTWERVADPLTDAKQYLADNNYAFDLFMDTKDVSTKMNPAVAKFGVKGIPAKFVIDGEGRIRYKLTGFSGGDDAAVEELSIMIETCKKAQS